MVVGAVTLAQSVPEPAPWRAGSPGFAAEFERLAGRSPTEAECEVACRAQEESVVWANGLLPEGLVHLAAALACGEGKRILFVSPQADLIELRQLRLGTRAPAYS